MSRWPVPRLPVYLALAGGVLVLGFSAIFVRWANAPGTVTGFYRMAIASALMALPFLRHRQAKSVRLPRQGALIAVLGGVFFGADLALWATGIMLSGATNPTLMANTAPVWVGLGTWLFFGERQKGQFWLGLAVALAGSAIVLGQELLLNFHFGLGTFLGVLAALFYGAYYLVTQRGRAHLDTLSYFWITTTSSAVILLVLNLALGQPLLGYPLITYLCFLALGVIVQVVGWLMITFVQGHLPAPLVSSSMLGQPVVTALLAGPLLGEKLTVWHVLGGAAVLAGVFLVHRSRWSG